MAVVVGGIRPLTGKFTIMFSYKGRGGRGDCKGSDRPNTARVASFDGSCGWHQAFCFVCFSFIYLVCWGGGSQSIFKHLHPSGVGEGGGVKGCDCHAQLEKHHDHVVVAVFGIRSLWKLSVFVGGGGEGPMYVVKILGQIYMFYFMLGGLIPKHSWSSILWWRLWLVSDYLD